MRNIYKGIIKKDKKFVLKNHTTLIVVVLLVLVGIIAFAQNRIMVKEKQHELEVLSLRYDQQLAKNNDLIEIIECDDIHEITERMIDRARDELDYVFPGERVIIVTAGN